MPAVENVIYPPLVDVRQPLAHFTQEVTLTARTATCQRCRHRRTCPYSNAWGYFCTQCGDAVRESIEARRAA